VINSTNQITDANYGLDSTLESKVNINKQEDITPTLQKEFIARRNLYAKERKDQQTARDAPLVAVRS
jgi:hypothetical protein